MDLRLTESAAWRHCAIVEVSDRSPELNQFVNDDSLRSHVDRAARSPTGYRWYEFSVDASCGERRVLRTAWAVLTELKRTAEEGKLDQFRTVAGEHWLEIGNSNVDDDSRLRISYAGTTARTAP